MILIDEPISIKTMSEAELYDVDSHQTHIGLPSGYIKEWKKPQDKDGHLIIREKFVQEVTFFINCIQRKSGKVDAPKIVTTVPKEFKGRDKDYKKTSVVKAIKQHVKNSGGDFKSKKFFFILGKTNDDKFLAIISELDEEVLIFLRQHFPGAVRIDKKNPVFSRVISPSDPNFIKIKNFTSFYTQPLEEYVDKDIDYSLDELLVSKNLEDARRNILKSIKLRQGQSRFRHKLLMSYNYKCCITESDIVQTLEACHIMPYMGDQTNTLDNGLIMRSDFHVLYDMGLFYIDKDYKIVLSNTMLNSHFYKMFDGRKIFLPKNKDVWPKIAFLKEKMLLSTRTSANYERR
tara:strand:- start:490 stop:1527 length:1038 start_codon:yes stop_codon:yes gene_type:complete